MNVYGKTEWTVYLRATSVARRDSQRRTRILLYFHCNVQIILLAKVMINFYHIDCLEVVQTPGEEGQDVGLQEPSVWELNVRKAEDTNQRCS